MGISRLNEDNQIPLYKYFTSTVSLITSRGETGRTNVMACEWTMVVCHKPLLVMSVIHKNDLTHEHILASKEFGVNVCSDRQVALVRLAGNTSGRDYDKMSDPLIAKVLTPASRINAPMIRGCLLNIECVIEQTLSFQTHTAFIGRAVAVRYTPERRPLVYHKGRFAHLGEWFPKPDTTNTQ
ncbi:MAG TPA: flavin reductase family protein [Ktedonobacteraceae bacterium]|nr:flavin reductase family protein [Ktedonobacteraceae bacterium]